MELRHFKSTQAAIEYITSDLLWTLREDLAAMTGSAADNYTEEDRETLEDKIADIEALAPLLTTAAGV